MSQVTPLPPKAEESFFYKHRIKLGIAAFITTFVISLFAILAIVHAYHLDASFLDWISVHPYWGNAIILCATSFIPLMMVWGSFCIAICLI